MIKVEKKTYDYETYCISCGIRTKDVFEIRIGRKDPMRNEFMNGGLFIDSLCPYCLNKLNQKISKLLEKENYEDYKSYHPIKDLYNILKTRTINSLLRRGIMSIEDIPFDDLDFLMNIRNFGKTTLVDLLSHRKELEMIMESDNDE